MRRVELLCILPLLMLSGCSRLDDYAAQHAGIYEDADYQKYVELKEEERLDLDGYYRDAAEQTEEFSHDTPMPQGNIHVTFAQNSHITVSYYLDAALTVPVDTQVCYLEPGSCIYAADPVCNNPNSDRYRFDCFRICEYGAGGEKTVLPWSGDNSLVICIPADYTGAEISVEPIGRYEDRVLSLHDYYVDSVGNKKELGGKWLVNSEETTRTSCTINPVASYSIDYEYDAEQYFFVSSEPFSYYHDKGKVSFETLDANSGVMEFSVELRAYAGAGDFTFDPSEYTFDHGKVTFLYQGTEVSGRIPLSDGSLLSYKAEPEKGYQLPDSDHTIVVNGSETEELIRRIRFYPEKQVLVHLPQPDIGGNIAYFIDGKAIAGGECTVNVGTHIKMVFSSWNGWGCEYLDGTEYIVTEEAEQTVNVRGFFYEADAYRPTLSVVLKDSIRNARFSISTSDVEETDLGYEGGSKLSVVSEWFGETDRRIFEGRIGTAEGITLKIDNDTIVNGYALKLEIVKTDGSDNESREIRYITKLPVQENLTIYDGNPVALYEQITITASKVAVIPCQIQSAENARIEVRFCDVNAGVLTPMEGGVAEPSREVSVTIVPEDGCYVTGFGVKNDRYSRNMKFSEWMAKAEDIIKKHPTKKLWHVTLDEADAYGTCVYKLDGRRVSGAVEIREGQKLTLEYLLTDPGYQIVRDSDLAGIIAGSINSSTEMKTIVISEALDGVTVRREDYIRLERKGE